MSRLVIGIGHPDRGDDAVGALVVKQLTRARTRLCSDCNDLMDMWAGEDDVVIVDAMRSGAAPGTVIRLDADRAELPARQFSSSHSFGLVETVELARSLGRLPRRLRIYGIEGADFALGALPSPQVTRASAVVAAEIEPAG